MLQAIKKLGISMVAIGIIVSSYPSEAIFAKAEDVSDFATKRI